MVDWSQQIKEARKTLDKLKAQRSVIKDEIANSNALVESLTKELVNTEKARIVVQNVAKELQNDIEFHISNIVTVALASVFNDPYEFKVEFVSRRNQTECDMFFVKDGNECDPMESSGGGALDIASLALRMAIWSIKKTRAIQVLDEPAKFLSRDMQDKASEMLKELSEKLGIQMILVSHIPEMISAADEVVQVELKGGNSNVRIIR